MTFPRGAAGIRSYGIGFSIESTGAVTHQTELQRTSDNGGAPATSAWTLVALLPPGQAYFRDTVPPSTLPYHYQARHRAEGETPGAWSTHFSFLAIPRSYGLGGGSASRPFAPVVRPQASQSGSTGELTLDISDPFSRLQVVKFKTHAGTAASFDFSDPTSSGWTTDASAPYSTSVSLTPKHNSFIAWAVGYTPVGSTSATGYLSGVVPFDADLIAEVTGLEAHITAAGVVEVLLTGDEDTRADGSTAFVVGVAAGSAPADPTAGSNQGSSTSTTRSATITTAITPTNGQTVTVKARAYNTAGTPGPVMVYTFTAYRRMTLPEGIQVSKGSQNLLGPDAGPTTGFLSGAFPKFYLSPTTGLLTLLRLEIGDVLSLRAKVLSLTGADRTRIVLNFYTGAGAVISTHPGNTVQSDVATASVVQNVTIPATTSYLRVYLENIDDTETSAASLVMLNEGAIALPFQEPPLRKSRETQDDLNNGPIYARMRGVNLSDGEVVRAPSGFTVGDTSFHNPNRHNEKNGTAKDTDSVTFATAYTGTPKIDVYPRNAKTYKSADITGDQYLDLRAESPSPSGFTVQAAIVDNGALASTPITDGFSSSQNASAPENGDVALSSDGDVAYSNLEDANANSTTYTARYDVDCTGMGATPNTVTVELWYNASAGGSGWTLGDSKVYSNSDDLTDEALSVSTALGADYDLRLRITYGSAPGANTATITAHGEDNAVPGVSYDKITTVATEYTMTPSGAYYVGWTAEEAP